MAVPAYERAAEYLRLSIVQGKLLPGQKIPQDEIGENLGISRMPVREALRKLEAEGFVRLLPNRGAIVRELSVQDIREVYQIRIELEGLAARLAAPRVFPEQLERLRRLMALMSRTVEQDDIQRLLELNKDFHHTCYESADNARLLRMIQDLRNYSLRYRVFHAHIPHRLRDSLHEHQAILRAFEARDGALAERNTKHNMQRTADILIEHLERLWGPVGMLTTVQSPPPSPLPTA
ncbi:MAG: GntR family transcriptional regulator [bacterium]